ncbi:MAG: hypothetical protein Q8P18_13015 [Pseudomonadota bacterium]|nr:hypothetical protein [Pseudomonadota bacterium]
MLRIALLVAHAVIELSVAALMWASPSLFFPHPDAETIALARSFGVGAGAVGLLSVLLLRWGRGDAGLVGALTLAAYQLGICVSQVLHPMAGVPAWVPPVFHGAFVVSFLVLAARARREGAPSGAPASRG